MKYLIHSLSLLIFIGCASNENNSKASLITSDDEATLRKLKTELWPKAYSQQDTALLNEILHDNFQLVDDNGDTYSKMDELEYISNYGPSYTSFVFEILRLETFDNGTAMVSGKGTMKGVDDQGAYITTYKSSNTLIKVEGQWKAINSHVSGVKEERFENAPE